ncbi:hypothetical protein IJX73_02290 [bacterium]|nr:hypothetical protein [bacterium]MBQ9149738.1 hypothetical protein [bacterium]
MQKISPVSQQETKPKKNIKGSIKAQMAGAAVQITGVPLTMLLASQLPKGSKGLTKDEIKIVNDGAQKVLKDLTNLGEKGVEIIDAAGKTKLSTNFPKWLENMMLPLNSAIEGKNAFFTSIPLSMEIPGNSVLLNKNKLPLTSFHELGHAFNFNNSKLWKAMQSGRKGGQMLASIFLLIPAITKNHKAKEGEELTGRQKFVNGLRNASPFLAAASMLPTLSEETMATLRGNKWAKDVFKDVPELAKKVAKTNKFGLATYAITAAMLGLATYVVKKVKDKSDEKIAANNTQKNTPNTYYSHQG